MDESDLSKRESVAEALSVLEKGLSDIFERAPVAMHMIDGHGTLVGVNRRWRQSLQYTPSEALGRKSVEFLTEESRRRAVEDTLPLFWRTGTARSVGYRFVKRDGHEIDVHMDADLVKCSPGNIRTFAALRSVDDQEQWEQASVTLKSLTELAGLRYQLGSSLLAEVDSPMPPQAFESQALSADAFGDLYELADDIRVSLRALPQIHDDRMSELVEHQQELVVVARSISRRLSEISDSIGGGTDTAE